MTHKANAPNAKRVNATSTGDMARKSNLDHQKEQPQIAPKVKNDACHETTKRPLRLIKDVPFGWFMRDARILLRAIFSDVGSPSVARDGSILLDGSVTGNGEGNRIRRTR